MKKAEKSAVSKLPALKTPQDLIHIRHYISILQYKYWVLMLRAYRDAYEKTGIGLSDEEPCFLSMKELVEHLGYQPKLSQIEDDLEALRKEAISFNALNKDGERVKEGTGFITSWVASPSAIGVVFPPILRRSVENLDASGAIFQLLSWQIFNSFSGKSDAVIYKLAKDYLGVGRTPYMTLESFRAYMGIKPNEYPDFKRLNQWVISGPIARINASELSDIVVEVEFKREMRRVVGLHFKVASSTKGKATLALAEHPAFAGALEAISLSDQRRYLRLFETTFIGPSITRANEYIAEQQAQGKSVNIGALYRKAIEEEWGRQHQARKVREADNAGAAQPKPQEAQQEAPKVVAELALSGNSSQAHKARQEHDARVQLANAIKALTPEQVQAHVRAYLAEIEQAGKDGTLGYKGGSDLAGDPIERHKFKVWQRQRVKNELNAARSG